MNSEAIRKCHICQNYGDHWTANCPRLVCAFCEEKGHAVKDCTFSISIDSQENPIAIADENNIENQCALTELDNLSTDIIALPETKINWENPHEVDKWRNFVQGFMRMNPAGLFSTFSSASSSAALALEDAEDADRPDDEVERWSCKSQGKFTHFCLMGQQISLSIHENPLTWSIHQVSVLQE